MINYLTNEGFYFLYRHIRLDKNEVFYIGVGTKRKHKNEKERYARAYLKANRNPFWKNVVNKTQYIVEIVCESNDYNYILQKEIEFIKMYGRKDLGLGSLVNLTDGGEGVVNLKHPHTEETKQKISKALKNKCKSEEHKQKLSLIKKQNKPNYWKNKKFSEEHKQKLRKSKQRTGLSNINKGKPNIKNRENNRKNYKVIIGDVENFYYLNKKELGKLLKIGQTTLRRILNKENTPKINIKIYERKEIC